MFLKQIELGNFYSTAEMFCFLSLYVVLAPDGTKIDNEERGTGKGNREREQGTKNGERGTWNGSLGKSEKRKHK